MIVLWQYDLKPHNDTYDDLSTDQDVMYHVGLWRLWWDVSVCSWIDGSLNQSFMVDLFLIPAQAPQMVYYPV